MTDTLTGCKMCHHVGYYCTRFKILFETYSCCHRKNRSSPCENALAPDELGGKVLVDRNHSRQNLQVHFKTKSTSTFCCCFLSYIFQFNVVTMYLCMDYGRLAAEQIGKMTVFKNYKISACLCFFVIYELSMIDSRRYQRNFAPKHNWQHITNTCLQIGP